MSFSISPLPSPSANVPNSSSPASQGAQSAREKAIAALMGSSAPNTTTPVPNPSSISVEEASAVKSQVSEPEKVKLDTNEPASESKAHEATTTGEEPLSTQYAILARKEKALRAKAMQQEQALKSKEAALQAREDALKAKDSEYQSNYVPKDRLQSNPLDVLAELGLSADQITQLALNAPSQESLVHKAEMETLKAEIRSLKEEQNGVKKTFEQRDLHAEQQVLKQFEREASMLVESDPNFETIKATNQVSEVVKLIHKTFKEDGILLTVEEACKEVEAELEVEVSKLSKLAKFQKFLAQKAEAAKPKSESVTPKESQQSQSIKTLTNNLSAGRPISARERAILAMQGKLNQG
jgi:hypothetical protein